MLKRILIPALFLTAFTSLKLSAQTSFDKGQNDLNVGIGVDNTLVPNGGIGVIPPISVSLEHGITDAISLGGYIAFTGSRVSYTGTEWCNHTGYFQNYTDTYTWIYTLIGFRGAYHFAKLIPVPKLDVYAGAMLGVDIYHSSFSTTSNCAEHQAYAASSNPSLVYISVFGGARYRFTDKIGVFGEIGYGVSVLSAGLNVKF
jgi:hypothetical protein